MTSRGDYSFKKDMGTTYLKVYRLGVLFLALPFQNNSGGRLLNRYSITMEIKLDELPYGNNQALLQTAKWNEDEAEVYINASGGIGYGDSFGNYESPKMVANKWHLVTITMDCIEGLLTTYLDGVQIQSCKPPEMAKDGRFALQDQVCLFGSNVNEETKGCNIRFMYFHNRKLSGQEVWDLYDTKQQESKWQCVVCSLLNLRDVDVCGACETPRALVEGLQSGISTLLENVVSSGGSTGEWKCQSCTLLNSNSLTTCAICDAPRPF